MNPIDPRMSRMFQRQRPVTTPRPAVDHPKPTLWLNGSNAEKSYVFAITITITITITIHLDVWSHFVL